MKKTLKTTENKDEAKNRVLKTAMLKREASKLRFEELEQFKKERSQMSQAEKYRIIEKHLNLQKIAECKYRSLILTFAGR